MERNAGRSERYCEHCAAGKKIKIMEAEICPDHIHMLIEIPPKVAVSSFMGYLKGKSSRMIHERFPELRYQYRNREFWCRGYYVDTAGKNAKKISEYIKHQLEEDQAGERLTMGNFQARLRAAGNSPSRLAERINAA
ncbi:Transposase IS200 like [Ruminococcaceae bacterium D5]|nr:Transposase IS200 like [Ruminococcaceae bacterium D5]